MMINTTNLENVEILNKTDREYLANLIPEDAGDWKKSWQEGYEIGKTIERMETPFHRKYGVKNDADLRLRYAKEGKIAWKTNMGLATFKDQIEGLKELDRFNEESGFDIPFSHQLPKNITGVPKDRRDGIPTGAGFDLNTQDDYINLTTASSVGLNFEDNHIGWPNAVEGTIYSLKAGISTCGLISTWHQVAPGCPDEAWNMNQIIKALGIVAAKYDEKVIVNDNMDDSLPVYCTDLTSYLAWAKLAKYITTDLCKCRYSFSFGNLTVNHMHKAAMWLAAHETFKMDDAPCIGFIYPDTVSPLDHDLHGNYGFLIPEALMCVLVERKYKTGASVLVTPITEKVAIPTIKNMLDIQAACQNTENSADFYEPLINWQPIEELRDKIMEYSEVMYQNVLNGFKEAGIDITNPVEMMVVTKKMNPTKFEELFHPSVVQEKKARVEPMLPAALWDETERQAMLILRNVKNEPFADKIKGRRICVASGDMHYFGYYAVTRVLEELGAEVIAGGTSLEAIDVLDLADEYGCKDICVSLHNGQALEYGKLLKKMGEERGRNYRFLLGGVLTSQVDENSTIPVDVTPQLNDIGLVTSTTIEDLIEKIANL